MLAIDLPEVNDGNHLANLATSETTRSG
jgi:hypothetical protein